MEARKSCHEYYVEASYLKVRYNFAERVAHEPGLGDVPQYGGRQAEKDDEEVGDGQVDNEHVGNFKKRKKKSFLCFTFENSMSSCVRNSLFLVTSATQSLDCVM